MLAGTIRLDIWDVYILYIVVLDPNDTYAMISYISKEGTLRAEIVSIFTQGFTYLKMDRALIAATR